jgi:hypothetical protein
MTGFGETSLTGAPRLPADLRFRPRVCPDGRYVLYAQLIVAEKTSMKHAIRPAALPSVGGTLLTSIRKLSV